MPFLLLLLLLNDLLSRAREEGGEGEEKEQDDDCDEEGKDGEGDRSSLKLVTRCKEASESVGKSLTLTREFRFLTECLLLSFSFSLLLFPSPSLPLEYWDGFCVLCVPSHASCMCVLTTHATATNKLSVCTLAQNWLTSMVTPLTP